MPSSHFRIDDIPEFNCRPNLKKLTTIENPSNFEALNLEDPFQDSDSDIVDINASLINDTTQLYSKFGSVNLENGFSTRPHYKESSQSTSKLEIQIEPQENITLNSISYSSLIPDIRFKDEIHLETFELISQRIQSFSIENQQTKTIIDDKSEENLPYTKKHLPINTNRKRQSKSYKSNNLVVSKVSNVSSTGVSNKKLKIVHNEGISICNDIRVSLTNLECDKEFQSFLSNTLTKNCKDFSFLKEEVKPNISRVSQNYNTISETNVNRTAAFISPVNLNHMKQNGDLKYTISNNHSASNYAKDDFSCMYCEEIYMNCILNRLIPPYGQICNGCLNRINGNSMEFFHRKLMFQQKRYNDSALQGFNAGFRTFDLYNSINSMNSVNSLHNIDPRGLNLPNFNTISENYNTNNNCKSRPQVSYKPKENDIPILTKEHIMKSSQKQTTRSSSSRTQKKEKLKPKAVSNTRIKGPHYEKDFCIEEEGAFEPTYEVKYNPNQIIPINDIQKSNASFTELDELMLIKQSPPRELHSYSNKEDRGKFRHKTKIININEDKQAKNKENILIRDGDRINEREDDRKQDKKRSEPQQMRDFNQSFNNDTFYPLSHLDEDKKSSKNSFSNNDKEVLEQLMNPVNTRPLAEYFNNNKSKLKEKIETRVINPEELNEKYKVKLKIANSAHSDNNISRYNRTNANEDFNIKSRNDKSKSKNEPSEELLNRLRNGVKVKVICIILI